MPSTLSVTITETLSGDKPLFTNMDYVEKRMATEAAKQAQQPEVATIMTPINLILLSLFVLIAYYQLRPQPKLALPKQAPATVFRVFTPITLRPYDGNNKMPVYLSVRGRVFDVTPGKNFYGPGGPYENFAGRDASRGLAHGSFDEDMLTKDLEGPLDTLEDLDGEQREALKGWEERFDEKYLVVGRLVPVGAEDEKVAASS